MQVDSEVKTSLKEDAQSSSPRNSCSPKTDHTKKQMQQTKLSSFIIKLPQTCTASVENQQHTEFSEDFELQSQSFASEVQGKFYIQPV